MLTQIAISIDCTKSMWPASHVVQREVATLVKFLFNSVPDLEIAIVCHGDDVDPKIDTTTINFTNNEEKLVEFINKIPRYGPNGTEEEFYQVVQGFVNYSLNWNFDAEKAYIFIGDSTPRLDAKFVDWTTIVKSFPKRDIKCFAVQCLDRPFAYNFWKEWTKLSEGKLIKLGQFSDLPNLLKILFVYNESVEKAEELLGTLNLTRSFNSSLFDLFGKLPELPGKDFSKAVLDNGLVPVNPARFQILKVDNREEIRQFVQRSGAAFRTGKGFYKLVKTEKVQPKKEVILVDRTSGEMFTGAKVRQMLGLPYGESGNLGRSSIPLGFDVFVQSTSYTRMLDKNTEFLYEVE